MDNQNNQDDQQEVVILNQGLLPKFKKIIIENKFIIIFISVLSVISFSTTGYLLIRNKKAPALSSFQQENIIRPPVSTTSARKTISILPSPTLPIPTIALVDQTATWSAFTSPNYSYSIKYPPDWTAEITTESDPKILEYVVFNPIATASGTLAITLSYGTRTYSETLALDPQVGESIAIASTSATVKNIKDSNGVESISVIVPFGLNTIILNAKDTYSDIFDQMLATLIFLN